MKRPSFQFYPADWRTNANLRRCSDAARGAWIDVMCVLHDSDEYGVARWPLVELARVAGVALKLAQELVSKLVLKGADSGPVKFAHTPHHAGKDGEPVILIEGIGPIWFSSRMVTDEWRRKVSGGKTRFGDTKPVTTPRQGDNLGGGATTSTSTSQESPSLRSGDGTQSKEISGERDFSRTKTARKTALPPLFPGLPECSWAIEYWASKGRADLANHLQDETEQFCDHHTKERTMSADWMASWRYWCRRSMQINRAPQKASIFPTATIHKVA